MAENSPHTEPLSESFDSCDFEVHELVLQRKRRKTSAQKQQRDHYRQVAQFYSLLPVKYAHTRQYTLLREAITWTDDLTRLLRRFCSAHRRTRIASNLDHKRLQFSLSEILLSPTRHSKHWGKLQDMLNSINGFLSRAYPYNTACDWSVLESLPDCGEQLPHRDYHGAPFLGAGPFDVSYAAILCITDGGYLKVYNCSSEGISQELIELSRGDLVVFRGDLIHAGTASVNGHFARLHAYLDSESIKHDTTSELVDITDQQIIHNTPKYEPGIVIHSLSS